MHFEFHPMKKVITTSEKETMDFGKRLARTFKGGEVIALHGDLGAGKTTLIKGIAKGLGIKKVITSPTFILMNVYKVEDLRFKIKVLIHIDCYRIKNEKDIEGIGAQEYFGRKDSVVVIEWPENIKKFLPKKKISVKIFLRAGTTRIILISHGLKSS